MLEQYILPKNSYINALDPRTKVITTFCCALCLALTQSLPAAGAGLLMALPLLPLSRIKSSFVLKRLLLVNGFILFLWLFLPFSIPGDIILRLFGLGITKQGIDQALLITLKSNAIMLIFITLLATLPVPDLGYALERLWLPKKFILLLLISYRYLNVIFDEYQRLLTAAKIRGFVPTTNCYTYKTFAYLVAMVFIKSFERAARVYQAMLLRGFTGTFHSLRTFKLSFKDYLFGGLVAGYIWILIWIISNPRFTNQTISSLASQITKITHF